HAADQGLQVVEQVGEGDEVQLGLDVGVLGQVAAGERLLGAEGGADAEDVAEGGQAGLEVQLRGLGQIGGLAVVVEGEQRGAALDLGLHHGGRGDLEQAALVEGGAEGPQHAGAHLHDGGGGVAAQHQVAVVVERLRVGVGRDARGDGVLVAGGAAEHGEEVGVQLTVVRGVLLGRHRAHLAVDGQRRLQRQRQRVVRAHQLAREHTLQQPVAVGQRDEDDILLRAQPVHTAQHPHARAGRVAVAQLHRGRVLLVEADAHGCGQRGILGDDNLLCVLQHTLALVGLLALAQGQVVLLGGFLHARLEQAGGLLHRGLGGGLPLEACRGIAVVGHGAGF
ncbi:hypothetical protein LOZ06_006892, partial [Ophidiomyces ophidiicola]